MRFSDTPLALLLNFAASQRISSPEAPYQYGARAKLEWEDAYRVGIKEIDPQHGSLAGLINEIEELIELDSMSEGKAFF